MNMKIVAAVVLCCAGLTACQSQPDAGSNSLTGPARLDSCITSSNGGGQRALSNAPNIGLNSQGATTTTPNGPNTKGNAY